MQLAALTWLREGHTLLLHKLRQGRLGHHGPWWQPLLRCPCRQQALAGCSSPGSRAWLLLRLLLQCCCRHRRGLAARWQKPSMLLVLRLLRPGRMLRRLAC